MHSLALPSPLYLRSTSREHPNFALTMTILACIINMAASTQKCTRQPWVNHWRLEQADRGSPCFLILRKDILLFAQITLINTTRTIE